MALSYAFRPELGETPEDLARRRQVAEALMARAVGAAPQNVGEGLNALGAAIGGRLAMNRVDKAEAAGRSSGNAAFASLFGGDGGGAGGAGGNPANGGGSSYRDAIAGIESAGSGDYEAIGPTHPKLGRALGRYQIMEANIGPWSKEVLGREVTPAEFMANPAIQDAIFDGKFGQYVQKYGPEGAARAWFGGPGNINNPGAKDVLGTTVGGYGQKFMNATGGAPAVAAALSGGGGANTMRGAPGGDMLTTPAPAAAQPAPVPRQPGRDPLPQTSGLMDRVAAAGHDSLAPGGTAAVAQALMAGGGSPGLRGARGGDVLAAPAAAPAMPPVAAPATAGAPPSATAAQPPAAGAQVAQADPSRLNQLMQAASNPWLTESQRGVVMFMLKQEMERADPLTQLKIQETLANIEKLKRPDTKSVGRRLVDEQGNVVYEAPLDPTTDIQEFEYGQENPGFDQRQIDLKRAGATNINTTDTADQAEAKALGAERVKFYATIANDLPAADSLAQSVNRMEQLMEDVTPGTEAAFVDWVRENTGVALTDDAGKLQAVQSLVDYLTPRMRVPGSGATSDMEMRTFRNSLPNLMGTAGGNQIVMDTLRGLTERRVDMALIAQDYLNKTITAEEATRQMRALPDPFAAFKKAQKAGPAPTPTPQPQSGAPGAVDWRTYFEQ